ncbi:ATP-binding protein [Pseudopedobacter saltans]|uniref:hypothetical protein n=1 Tax=Pseudopedobacter saltans TaxID=151895 RepID=UPI0001EBBFD6|nr:hypothetical protein [Pseudopedobacter saltans]
METKELNIETCLSKYLIDLIDHDVRAPMKNFAYYLSLFEKKEIDTNRFDLTELLGIFFSSSSFLMENHILFQRIMEKRLGNNNRMSKLSQIANEIRVEFLHHLFDKQVHLSFNFDKNQLLNTDRDLFKFVFKNVIYTILCYSNKGNAVYIELSEDGKYLELKSIDMFIPNEKMEYMFNLQEYKNVSGKDIGILLSLHLLQISNGNLFYEQNDSGESKFKLYFG